MKRFSTKHPGVFYRNADRIGGPGKEKVFYIVFKKDGKVHEEKAGRQYVDDMSAAKAARYRGERIEGKRLSPKDIRQTRRDKTWTINALWDEYKQAHPENKGLKNEDSKFLKNVEDGIGRKKPEELSLLDVDRLRIKLQKVGKHTTAVRVLELLRRTINFGVNRALIKPLPFKIKIPTLNNQTTEDLSSEQLNSLLMAIDKDPHPHAGPMMKLTLFSGLRRGELFSLQWKDIDFDRGFINIRDPKGGADQKIPVNDGVRTILGALSRNDGPYVFPGRNGGRRTSIGDQVRRIKKAAGLPEGFRPLHGLRHVFASMLASSGEVDMYTLQKLLTHKSPAMTMRYAHLRDKTLKRASVLAGSLIERIERAVNDTKSEKVVSLNHKK